MGAASLRPILAGAAACAAALAACGDGRTFDAPGFVAAANEHGAEIELGEELPTSQSDLSIHALELGHAEEAGAAEAEHGAAEAEHGPAEAGHAHGAATLTIAPDEERAIEEHRRCEGAVTLVCYRAANAVVIVQGAVEPADAASLTEAIRALGSEG